MCALMLRKHNTVLLNKGALEVGGRQSLEIPRDYIFSLHPSMEFKNQVKSEFLALDVHIYSNTPELEIRLKAEATQPNSNNKA